MLVGAVMALSKLESQLSIMTSFSSSMPRSCRPVPSIARLHIASMTTRATKQLCCPRNAFPGLRRQHLLSVLLELPALRLCCFA